MGESLGLVWTIPFVGILLSIALCPLFMAHFWHHHFPKVSIGWALLLAVPFLIAHGSEAWHAILHIYLVDYVPFIILLASLFTISGGIYVRGTLAGTPMVNATLILIGTAVASWIGTTGASMLMIRPLLRANENRRHKVHTVVFFIFLVSNIGGALTPLGDPPLFLGFLHGVPFTWTLIHLWPQTLLAVVLLLAAYLAIDVTQYRRESASELATTDLREPIRVEGWHNFLFLGGVVGGVLLSGSWKPDHIHVGHWIEHGELIIIAPEGARGDNPPAASGSEASAHDASHGAAEGDAAHHGLSIPVQNLVRDAILIVMAALSMATTARDVRQANGFSWAPIKEVAWLFAGIFMTIIPALEILRVGERGALASLLSQVRTPAYYFWVTGGLSSFLDNAPTYLTFFNTALGRYCADQPTEAAKVAHLIETNNVYLVAIALGAVFMGANTYIGNAPNFMVKAIAEESGVRMPNFLSYMLYSVAILIPAFIVITLVFLR